MLHLCAYSESHANTTNEDITPVVDDVLAISNGHFFPQRDYRLFAAAYMSLTALRCRINTPSMRQVTLPWIRPTIPAILPTTMPGVADYRNNPFLIKAQEELAVEATHTTAGGAVTVVGLWLSDGVPVQAPQGDIFTMRATGATTAVASTWTTIAPTWADTLPAGSYAVVGMQAIGATCKLARLIFENQPARPGCLGQTLVSDNGHPMFRMGGIGVFGRFTSNRMPIVQYLCGAADTAQEIYLDIVRVS